MFASTALLIVSNVVASCFRVQQKVYTRLSAFWVWASFVSGSGHGIDDSTKLEEPFLLSAGFSPFLGVRLGF